VHRIWSIAVGVGLALALTTPAWSEPPGNDDHSGSAASHPGGSGTVDDKAKVDAQLAQVGATLEAATERAQQAAVQYATATAALPGAQTALAEARGRVAAAEAAARQAARVAAAAQQAYQEADRAYQAATAVVEKARDQVSTFVSAAYRGSALVALNSVFAAQSPTEIAQRLSDLNQIAVSQQRALDAVTRARWTAKDRQHEAQLAQDKAKAAKDAADQALSTSRAAQSAAERAATDVQNLITEREQALATANSERAAVLAQYNELRAESERIAAELRARASRSGGRHGPALAMHPGYFLMPTQGFKSSNFGMRYDPYYHVWQLHAGVDIAASGGQSIYAAADGEVVHAGWSGGYGNYTCVSHGTYQGKDLSTCYGHQSRILVSVGQTVHRGDLIGRVGSTGASTGYHLHFEVRLNGDPVNPLGWLPGCLCR
jgi:murein DD-endopeptidase MepM/ murein hydrolase activator NlpD